VQVIKKALTGTWAYCHCMIRLISAFLPQMEKTHIYRYLWFSPPSAWLFVIEAPDDYISKEIL
jgi:hypothetical protein